MTSRYAVWFQSQEWAEVDYRYHTWQLLPVSSPPLRFSTVFLFSSYGAVIRRAVHSIDEVRLGTGIKQLHFWGCLYKTGRMHSDLCSDWWTLLFLKLCIHTQINGINSESPYNNCSVFSISPLRYFECSGHFVFVKNAGVPLRLGNDSVPKIIMNNTK